MSRLMILGLTLALAGTACSEDKGASGGPGGPGGPGGGRGPRPFPVEVQRVSSRNVTYTVTAVGSVEAFEEVQVTARVAGVVEKVRFTEGQVVKAGLPLVEIEPQRYQLAVGAARATLDKAEAALADAKAGLARREQAGKDNPGLVPGEEIETWRTRVLTAQADIAAARVALNRAQLDLRDAYVRAPVAGVLQTRTVRTGQYVQPGTVLGTLVQREPLLLRFDVPSREAAGLSPGVQVEFTTGTSAEEAKPYTARIVLVSAAADQATRMVPVTAEVNDERLEALRPGAFARVTVHMGDQADAVVIPQIAVRPSERGFLAFVVVNGKAEERVLDLGMRTADGMVEVRSGLNEGEELVLRGAEALSQGAPVMTGKAPPGREGAGQGGDQGGDQGIGPGGAVPRDQGAEGQPGQGAPGDAPGQPSGSSPGQPSGQPAGKASGQPSGQSSGGASGGGTSSNAPGGAGGSASSAAGGAP